MTFQLSVNIDYNFVFMILFYLTTFRPLLIPSFQFLLDSWVPITCAFATPPSPERSMVRVSSHMIQYAPSGSAIRSWKRGGRPPAQPKVRVTLPSGSISTHRGMTVGSGMEGRAT